VRSLAVLVAMTAAASAGDKPEVPRTAWVGVFRPAAKTEPSDVRTIVARAGEVVVLTPATGAPPSPGDITVVQPLTGMNLAASVREGRIALPFFALDRREGADAVLLLPAGKTVVFVEPSKADVIAIRAALMRNDALSGVRRALDGIEVGAIDIDGDKKPDFAVTYGCNAWADGSCQSHGEFLLARRGMAWVELE